MAPNGQSNLHNDAYQTDTYWGPGPLGVDMTRTSTLQAGRLRLGDLRLARPHRDRLRRGCRARGWW